MKSPHMGIIPIFRLRPYRLTSHELMNMMKNNHDKFTTGYVSTMYEIHCIIPGYIHAV